MVESKMTDRSFMIRFEDVTDEVNFQPNVLIVDKSHRDDFINLALRFELRLYKDKNDNITVRPSLKTRADDLKAHISTWDIMLHKYMSYSNDFKRENAECRRKSIVSGKVIPIPKFVEKKEVVAL